MPETTVPPVTALPSWSAYRPLWRGIAWAYLIWGLGLWVFPRPDIWVWRYAGPGVQAQGRLETVPLAGEAAAVRITQISGERNGVTIADLQPVGAAIPGNEPYHVDNRLSLQNPPLTGDGVGYRLADGSYANFFFQTHTNPHDFREYFSQPPFVDGSLGPEDAETRVTFEVSRLALTPLWWSLWPAALAVLGVLMRRWWLGRGSRGQGASGGHSLDGPGRTRNHQSV